MDFDQRSATTSTSAVVRYIGSTVSPSLECILPHDIYVPHLIKDTTELIADDLLPCRPCNGSVIAFAKRKSKLIMVSKVPLRR